MSARSQTSLSLNCHCQAIFSCQNFSLIFARAGQRVAGALPRADQVVENLQPFLGCFFLGLRGGGGRQRDERDRERQED